MTNQPPTPSPQPPALNPQPGLSIWNRLLSIDRRILFLFIGLVVVVPLFAPFIIRPLPTEPVESLFRTIDSIPQDKALVLSVDYTPDIEPELHPMTIALLRHAFARRIKVGVLCLQIQGIGLADTAIRQVTGEFNARARDWSDSLRYGRDYVFWGYQTPVLMVLTGMGEDISKVFLVDAYKNRTDTLPIMQEIRNYNSIGFVVSIAGSSLPMSWIIYAQTVFGVKIGTGITAVSAADFYPYYSKTRQFSGILAGMKGAAEYEEIVELRYPQTRVGIPALGASVMTHEGKGRFTARDLAAGTGTVSLATGEIRVPLAEIEYPLRRLATERMSSQTTAHVGIMLLIVIGNVAFFVTRRRKS
jgi:hypothetical protein